jgi:hypothetical protein
MAFQVWPNERFQLHVCFIQSISQKQNSFDKRSVSPFELVEFPMLSANRPNEVQQQTKFFFLKKSAMHIKWRFQSKDLKLRTKTEIELQQSKGTCQLPMISILNQSTAATPGHFCGQSSGQSRSILPSAGLSASAPLSAVGEAGAGVSVGEAGGKPLWAPT